MIPPALRPRLEFAAKAFLVASFLGTLTAGVLRLQQKALADEAHHADLGRWEVVEKPAWCTLDDVRAIRDATHLRGWRASVMHPGSGPVVWRSIELTPQVARVAGMRRRLPDAFEAVIELRSPVAAVETSSGGVRRWVEVDGDGVALSAPLASRPVRAAAAASPARADPAAAAPSASTAGPGGAAAAVPAPPLRALRVITGATGPVPAPGARFGAAVAAAADLATALDSFGTPEDRVLLASLDEIDVSNLGGAAKPGASEVVLRSTGWRPDADGRPTARPASRPCDVEWGRVRTADAYDPEPAFGTKAARLAQALRMFPRLEGLRTVKVAFQDLVVVPAAGSPLAAAASPPSFAPKR